MLYYSMSFVRFMYMHNVRVYLSANAYMCAIAFKVRTCLYTVFWFIYFIIVCFKVFQQFYCFTKIVAVLVLFLVFLINSHELALLYLNCMFFAASCLLSNKVPLFIQVMCVFVVQTSVCKIWPPYTGILFICTYKHVLGLDDLDKCFSLYLGILFLLEFFGVLLVV